MKLTINGDVRKWKMHRRARMISLLGLRAGDAGRAQRHALAGRNGRAAPAEGDQLEIIRIVAGVAARTEESGGGGKKSAESCRQAISTPPSYLRCAARAPGCPHRPFHPGRHVKGGRANSPFRSAANRRVVPFTIARPRIATGSLTAGPMGWPHRARSCGKKHARQDSGRARRRRPSVRANAMTRLVIGRTSIAASGTRVRSDNVHHGVDQRGRDEHHARGSGMIMPGKSNSSASTRATPEAEKETRSPSRKARQCSGR
jgi:hypothetical protein